MTISVSNAIESARAAAGISQRALAEETGISQPTLNRIINGSRQAKMPELVLIAEALGCPINQLTGSEIADRVQMAARSTNGSGMEVMRQRLMHFIELDAYLEDQGL